MPFNPNLQLNAVVVNLVATRDGRVPLTQGALAHAAFFDLVRAADPDLAARLHESGSRQPFTISPLWDLPTLRGTGAASAPVPGGTTAEGSPLRYDLRAGDRAVLRLTLLDPELFVAFLQRLLAEGPQLQLRIGDALFAIESVLGTPGSHPWAGYSTTGELRRAASTEPQIRLHFASPTAVNLGSAGAAKQRMVLIPIAIRLRLAARGLEPVDRRRDPHRVRGVGGRLRLRARGAPLADGGPPTQAGHLSRRLRRCDLRGAGPGPHLRANPQPAGRFRLLQRRGDEDDDGNGAGEKVVTRGYGDTEPRRHGDVGTPRYGNAVIRYLLVR